MRSDRSASWPPPSRPPSAALPAAAQAPRASRPCRPGLPEIVPTRRSSWIPGHQFFGSASRGLALAVQEAVRRWGEPNGYILGQEASGAFFGGLRYGEGKLYTRNAGERKVYWQGPSSASTSAATAPGR